MKTIDTAEATIYEAPGGWIVQMKTSAAPVVFIPDATHMLASQWGTAQPPPPPPPPTTSKWMSGYYAGWAQDAYPPSAIDFAAMTHVIHFAVMPKADGSLDDASLGVTASRASALVAAAHAAGKKVLITVGGESTQAAFLSATSPANIAKFVMNLVNLMRTRGYDGIDIDWEPLQAGDSAQYTALVNALNMAFDSISPRPLLAAATAYMPTLFGQLASKFNQINLMSYYMSGPYSGWVTWHNSPLYNGGKKFPSTGALLPSIDTMVDQFVAAGVPLAKIGIGMAFHGEVWKGGAGTDTGGVTKPLQSWTTAPTMTGDVSYDKILMTYPGATMLWDNDAHVPYLSVNQGTPATDVFVSYDDPKSLAEKVAYIGTKKVGGAIIWELSEGYRPMQPVGSRDPLLQAVKTAFVKLV